MRRFLKRFLFFGSLITVGVMAVLCLTTWWVSSRFDYKIPEGKNILVLGDSHTQCAINPTVFPQALNLSESADTYFYSYVKLKKILEHNKQIDTLIIGYSHNNIAKAQDNWLADEAINGSKLPVYFFLFERSELNDFIGLEPLQLAKNIPGIIRRNFSHGWRIRQQAPISRFGIGDYKPIDHVIGAADYTQAQTIPEKFDGQLGSRDIGYLKKIYNRCERRNIKVILLAPPVLLSKSKENPFYAERYETYAQQQLPHATKINYSDLQMPKDYFADAAHLNAKGASRFTAMLREKLAVK